MYTNFVSIISGASSVPGGYGVASGESHMFMQASDPSSLGMGSFMGSGRLPFDLKVSGVSPLHTYY